MDRYDDVPIDPDLAPSDPSAPGLREPPPAARSRARRADPAVLAVISVGGMFGASARYGIAKALPVQPGRFPWATFWANMSGSFLLGLLLVLIVERLSPARYRHLRPFVATGFFGAYTTMSTYQTETAVLLKDGHAATALAYWLGSVVVGLAVAYLGVRAARLAVARPAEWRR